MPNLGPEQNFIAADLHSDPGHDYMNTALKLFYNRWMATADKIRFLHRPDLTPFPHELAAARFAIYPPGASVTEVRRAAYNAPDVNGRPLAFRGQWKPSIDAITGTDTAIYHGPYLQATPGPEESITQNLLFLPKGNVFLDMKLGPGPDVGILDALESLLAPCFESGNMFYFGHVLPNGDQQFILEDSLLEDVTKVLGDVPPPDYFVVDRGPLGV